MKNKREPDEKEILAEIDRDFARWDEIMRDGCADPSWPDGVNLNLKRNHIIYGYKRLQEAMMADVQLSLFDLGFDMRGMRPIPPKVPENYMVKNGKYADTRIPRLKSFGYDLVFEY